MEHVGLFFDPGGRCGNLAIPEWTKRYDAVRIAWCRDAYGDWITRANGADVCWIKRDRHVVQVSASDNRVNRVRRQLIRALVFRSNFRAFIRGLHHRLSKKNHARRFDRTQCNEHYDGQSYGKFDGRYASPAFAGRTGFCLLEIHFLIFGNVQETKDQTLFCNKSVAKPQRRDWTSTGA